MENKSRILTYSERRYLAIKAFGMPRQSLALITSMEDEEAKMNLLHVPTTADELSEEHQAIIAEHAEHLEKRLKRANEWFARNSVIGTHASFSPVYTKDVATELSRGERLWLATREHGLYTFGMATTDSDRTDEDCAMDNQGIPRYRSQLTDKQKAFLAERDRVLFRPSKEFDFDPMQNPVAAINEHAKRLREKEDLQPTMADIRPEIQGNYEHWSPFNPEAVADKVISISTNGQSTQFRDKDGQEWRAKATLQKHRARSQWSLMVAPAFSRYIDYPVYDPEDFELVVRPWILNSKIAKRLVKAKFMSMQPVIDKETVELEYMVGLLMAPQAIKRLPRYTFIPDFIDERWAKTEYKRRAKPGQLFDIVLSISREFTTSFSRYWHDLLSSKHLEKE